MFSFCSLGWVGASFWSCCRTTLLTTRRLLLLISIVFGCFRVISTRFCCYLFVILFLALIIWWAVFGLLYLFKAIIAVFYFFVNLFVFVLLRCLLVGRLGRGGLNPIFVQRSLKFVNVVQSADSPRLASSGERWLWIFCIFVRVTIHNILCDFELFICIVLALRVSHIVWVGHLRLLLVMITWSLFDYLVIFSPLDHSDLAEMRQKVGPHHMMLENIKKKQLAKIFKTIILKGLTWLI